MHTLSSLEAVTAPLTSGWWQVDWPDGRHTYYRHQGDAEQLADRIRQQYSGCDTPRNVEAIS